MAEGLGLLAGGTAIVLAGALACMFFRKCGMLSASAAAILRRALTLCVCFGALFFSFGLLIRFLSYGPDQLCPPWEIFSSAGVRAALDGVSRGSSPLFLPAYGLGLLFSGSFPAAGMTLSFLLSFLSLFLILKALSAWLGDQAAFRIAVLLLSLPGAFLIFLPGNLPYAVLLISILIYFLIRNKTPRAFAFPPFLWEGLLALSSLISAAVMYLYGAGYFS